MTIHRLAVSTRSALRLAAVMFLVVTSAAEEVSPDEQVARRFAPENVLKEIATSDSTLAELSIAVERVDLDRCGSADYLVAAYAGVEEGALRVLRLSPVPSVVADAPQPLGGASVELKLIDVDGDGTPEIAVYFSQLGPSEAWSAMQLYRWADRRLQWLSEKPLKDPVFEDLNGDGVAEIIESIFRNAEPIQRVYTLSNRRYVPSGGLLSFERVFGSRSPQRGDFEIEGTNPTGILKVRNGTHEGARRARAAEVLLNGVVVLNAGDLVSNRFAEVEITLQEKNTLEVRIFEPSDSEMLVWIPAPATIHARVPVEED